MLGIGKLFKSLLGNKSDRDIKEVEPVVGLVNDAWEQLRNDSNDQLRARSERMKNDVRESYAEHQARIDELKTLIAENPEMDPKEKDGHYQEIDKLEKSINEQIEAKLEELLPEAFALVKETASRFTNNEKLVVTATDLDRDIAASRDSVEIMGNDAVWHKRWMAAGAEVEWNMIHYDVQLIGGTVLHRGKIAEMATGEGKTLVATLPVFLNALAGKGVHVVTVNDYLAKRDSEWMGPIFEFHGLTVDCIDKHRPNSDERRAAYKADITYGTNNEFGFDYLRDNMAKVPEELVQRKHHYAIVDEVDSVLIDDARTPLIISGPTERGSNQQAFVDLKPKVEKLVSAQRKLVNTFLADAKKKLANDGEGMDKKAYQELTSEGGMALLRAHRGLPKNNALIKFLSEPGMKQQLTKTENFYLQDHGKEMHKVDAELFFVIDEKNNTIELTEKGIDLVSTSNDDKDFFVLPDVGAVTAEIEQSGRPDEEKRAAKEALTRDYSVKAERIHTMNQLLKAYTLFEKDVEYLIMDNKVKIVDEQTGRTMEGRRYSDGLHQAIEAKENVKIEAATQTYATVTLQNYFRMYHKLAGMTGTAETEAGEFWEIYKLDVVVIPTNRPIARQDLDDLVYKTKREKYNAVIEEVVRLRDSGRPVLVGTTSVEVSELLSRMLNLQKIKHQVLNAKQHAREADVVAEAGKPGTVTIATNMAGRGTDIKLGDGVKEAGGLAIVGTERHESRRVDRQLRGRSGRQGDPGSSQFFVSLEDNLMRLFTSERISKVMDRLGIEEGEVISHSLISRSIERAQRKVEENHFGTRKRLLEYDDVMNSQREVIYRKRRNALHGERLSLDIAEAMDSVAETLVDEHQEMRDYDGFKLELMRILGIDSPVSEEQFMALTAEEISAQVKEQVTGGYQRKCQRLAEAVLPVVKNVYETQGEQYKNIRFDFTDGMSTLRVIANLEKSVNTEGRELITTMEKGVTLAMIDQHWKEHLRELDDLRQAVHGAVYEQKDPLLIYKFESFELFRQMMNKVNREIVSFLLRSGPITQDPNQVQRAEAPRPQQQQRVQTSRQQMPELAGAPAGGGAPPQQQGNQQMPQQARQQPKPQPVRVEKKVGRNDPCPCGSGKKYKQCHGKAGAEQA